MSLLATLRPRKGATHSKKRRGRGHATGQGGTAGKGHKGQKARTGGRVRWGFEGGQTPLMRRLPKFGFNNKNFQTKYDVFNLSQLEAFGAEFNPELAAKTHSIKFGLIKILGHGKITKAVTVKAHKFSESAQAAIKAAGGRVEVIA